MGNTSASFLVHGNYNTTNKKALTNNRFYRKQRVWLPLSPNLCSRLSDFIPSAKHYSVGYRSRWGIKKPRDRRREAFPQIEQIELKLKLRQQVQPRLELQLAQLEWPRLVLPQPVRPQLEQPQPVQPQLERPQPVRPQLELALG